MLTEMATPEQLLVMFMILTIIIFFVIPVAKYFESKQEVKQEEKEKREEKTKGE